MMMAALIEDYNVPKKLTVLQLK